MEREKLNGNLDAVVTHVQAVGPVVRVTLTVKDNPEDIEAELTRDIFKALDLKKGEAVFVRPRNMKVFDEDYQI